MWYYRKGSVLTIPGIIVATATFGYAAGAIGQIIVAKTLNRIVRGNDYIAVWVCIVGIIMGLQALYVMSTFRATTRYLSYPAIWMIYSVLIGFHILLLIAGFAIVETPIDSISTVPLLILDIYIFWYAMRARRGYCIDKIMGLPDYRVRLADSYGRSYFYLLASYVFSWFSKFLVVLILLSLTIQSYWVINDYNNINRPGQLVVVTAVSTTKQYKMHVYCSGLNSGNSHPTFVLLSDFGHPGVSMIDLVNSIASQGYAACLIDRPGYGWSEPGYFPQRPENLVDEINQALLCYPVPKPYILVGWGSGGLYAQLYIQKFQSSVYGVALLNVYPSHTVLEDYAYNNTVVLQNLVSLATGQYGYYNKPYEKSISVKYESWRAFSVLAYARATLTYLFYGLSESTKDIVKSLSYNNRYYQACYFEYGFTGNNIYVDLLQYVTNSTNSFLQMNSWPMRWPSFPSGTASFTLTKRQDSSDLALHNLVTTVNSTVISVTNTTSIQRLNTNANGEAEVNYDSSSTATTWSVEATPTWSDGGSSYVDSGSSPSPGSSTQPGELYNTASNDNLAARQINLSPAPAFLSPVPLLIMVDQMSTSGDCALANIRNPRDCQNYQALSWFKYLQQVQYYQTLSSKATFVICTSPVSEDNKVCNTDFVLTRPNWLAGQLINRFLK